MIKTLTAKVVIGKRTERVMLVLMFSVLTFAAALIKIYTPFSPIPFTLQTFVVFLAAYKLRPIENGISQALYIFTGMIGAPVFAAGISGAAALVGPTAGYLAGFIAAGMVMSFIFSKFEHPGFIGTAAVFTAGSLIILSAGTIHLAFAYKMGIANAFMVGFIPFAAAEAVKIAAAASFFRIIKR